MKNQFKYLIIFLSISLLFSCSKDEEVIIEPVQTLEPIICTTGGYNLGDTVIAGSCGNMKVFNLNYTLSQGSRPFNAWRTYNIDLNQDGIDDFEFKVQNIYDQREVYAKSYLNCLTNNSFINGLIKTDTTFFRLDTIPLPPSCTSPVVYQVYSCNRLTPTDSIFSTIPNQLNINIFNSGDILNNSMNYQSINSTLYEESYTGYQSSICVSRDIYDKACDLFPLNQIQYIGVRLIDGNGNTKLGWIKINHIDSRTILIMQSAIQQ